MRFRWWVLVVLAALPTFVHAQRVMVAAPADRFGAPGEYVTLVFRVATSAAVDVVIGASTDAGWPILRQAGSVRLEEGRSTPVAVTVQVPADAPALLSAWVTLVVDVGSEQVEGRSALTVTELVDLGLEVPREFVLGSGDLAVVAANRGNTPEPVVVEFRRVGRVVERRELVLFPGARDEIRFAPLEVGTHTVVLTSARSGEVRRAVEVQRFGVAAPEPFALAAEVVGDLAATGRLRGAATLSGPLSDFVSLDAAVDVGAWRRTYAELAFPTSTLRIGGGWRDPFRLSLPSPFGVSGDWRSADWSLAAAAGDGTDDRITGVVAGRWASATADVAGAVGVAAGTPLAALRGDWTTESYGASFALAYREAALDAALAARIADGLETMDVDVALKGLAGGAPRLTAALRHQVTDGTLYADGAWALDGAAPPSGRLGLTVGLTSTLPGDLTMGVQGGTRSSHLKVGHRFDLGEGWRTANTLGVQFDEGVFGVSLDSSWTRLGADFFALDARLVYAPAFDRWDGRVGIRYQVVSQVWTVGTSGNWDVGDGSLGASTSVGWRDGPWHAELTASASYALAVDAANPWRASALLGVGYGFALQVPTPVSEVFGGRAVGVLEGRLLADGDVGVPGVVFEVGRYRVQTDDDGAFRVEIPPGTYAFATIAATVPVAYRLLDAAPLSVEVRLRDTTAVVLRAARTTALTGRVLEDRDGDGVADDPPRGVRARLVLTDAEGLRRVLSTDDDGRFVARGLIPGDVDVALVGLPLGAEVLGDVRRTVRVAAGGSAAVDYLVRPVAAQAQSFAPRALRIRSVVAEVDRVPPGSAPLLRVEVQGDPDAVEVETLGGRTALEFDGESWIGRVEVPSTAQAGVWAYTVVVRAVDAEATRRGQIVVDPAAEAFVVASDAPGRRGADLRVSVTVYFDAAEVRVRPPFGGEVALVEVAPGRWAGSLPVPADAADGVVAAPVEVVATDGGTLTGELRFRVLVP